MTNYITSAGVQSFTITIASGSTTGTVTLTNAVGSGAFILQGGLNPSVSNQPAESFASLTKTSSTVITATRNTGTAGTIVVTGCIVDGTSSLVNSAQYGTISVATASTTGTATISSVTAANTAIHLLGWQTANTTLSALREFPVLTLSGTTLTATRTASTGALVVGFCIIEFAGAALNQSVQQVAATSSSSVTSYTATITAVVKNNTICILSGYSIATSTTNIGQSMQGGTLTSTTVYTANVGVAVANAKKFNVSIVEFVSGVLNSAVQRGNTTVSAALNNTTSLSSVVLANSGIAWQSNITTATTAVMDRAITNGILSTNSPVPSVRNQIYNTASGTQNTLAVTVTSSTAGDLLVANISGILEAVGAGTLTVTGVTDNLSQTWAQATGAQGTYTASGIYPSITDIWYFPNTASGVTTVTITFSGAGANPSALLAEVWQIQNCATTSPLDVAGVVNNGAVVTGNAVTAALTTTKANDIIVTSMGYPQSGTAVNSPYTIGPDSINYSAYHIPSTTVSAETATFTGVAAGTYGSTSAAFFAAPATQVVSVSKATSTALTTSSWEVFEFPAPTSGAATSANLTEASDIFGSIVTQTVNISANLSEASDTISGNVAQGALTSANLTEASDVIAGNVLQTVSISGNLLEASDVISGNITVITLPVVSGNLVEASDIISAAIAQAVLISANLTEASDVISASVKQGIVTSANLTESSDIISGNVAETTALSANLTESSDVISTNIFQTIITSGNLFESSDIISGNVIEAVNDNVSGGLVEGSDIISGNLSLAVLTSGNLTEATDTISANVAQATVTSANLTEGGDTISGNLSVAVKTSGNLTEASDVIAGNVSQALNTSANLTEGSDVIGGNVTSTQIETVSGNLFEAGDTISAAATSTGGGGHGAGQYWIIRHRRRNKY